MSNQNPNIPESPEPSAVSENLPTPYNNNRITPDNSGLGGVIGQGLQDASKVAATYAQKQQALEEKATNDANNSAAAKAVSSYGNATLDAFYGDGDKTPGFNSVEGHNAPLQSQKVLDDNAKLRAKIRDGDGTAANPGLSNQEQKDRFDSIAQQHADTLYRLVHGHAASQVEVAQQGSEKALVDTRFRTIATTAADQTQGIKQIFDAIDAGINEALLPDSRRGADDATMANSSAKYIASAAEKAIQGALSSKSDNDQTSAVAAQRAQAILDRYGSKMDPALVEQYGKAIRGLSLNVNASQKANELMTDARPVGVDAKGHLGDNFGPIDSKKLWNSVAAMPEGDLKDATMRLVTERTVMQDKAKNALADNYYSQLKQLGDPNNTGVFKMPNSPAALDIRAKLNQLDPAKLSKLHDEAMHEDIRQLNLLRTENAMQAREAKLAIQETKAKSRDVGNALMADVYQNPDAYKDRSSDDIASKFPADMEPGEKRSALKAFTDWKTAQLRGTGDYLKLAGESVEAAKIKKGTQAFSSALGGVQLGLRDYRDDLIKHNKTPTDEMMKAQAEELLLDVTIKNSGIFSNTVEPLWQYNQEKAAGKWRDDQTPDDSEAAPGSARPQGAGGGAQPPTRPGQTLMRDGDGVLQWVPDANVGKALDKFKWTRAGGANSSPSPAPAAPAPEAPQAAPAAPKEEYLGEPPGGTPRFRAGGRPWTDAKLVSSKAEFDALPEGALYRVPGGYSLHEAKHGPDARLDFWKRTGEQDDWWSEYEKKKGRK